MTTKRIVSPVELPEGFLYQPDFLSAGDEAEMLRTIATLEFGAYDFRGYIAKRRVVTYGGGYESGSRRMAITADAIREFLASIRDRAATVAGMPAEEIVQAMVTEYSEGTPIGWHRDSPQFEVIIGISLRSACRLRLKPYKGEGKIISVMLEPRSIYVMNGPARWNFQHSIPAVKDLRYSITLRTLSKKRNSRAA
ncbi:MAG TPA: alpha-ketoglutarate-dependent dioxygenase AlkB [Candidatus Sulfotelmatobacter sp.]